MYQTKKKTDVTKLIVHNVRAKSNFINEIEEIINNLQLTQTKKEHIKNLINNIYKQGMYTSIGNLYSILAKQFTSIENESLCLKILNDLDIFVATIKKEEII